MKPEKFDSKWLEDYESKRAKASAAAPAGLQDTQRERACSDESLGKNESKAAGTSRPIICYISLRTRLLDFENLVYGTKGLTDAMRYSGIIEEDTSGDVTIRHFQEKVAHRDQEKTIILIYNEPVPW